MKQTFDYTTTDNNRGNCNISDPEHRELIEKIAGRSIDDLEKKNTGLLVVKGKFKDDVEESKICSLANDKLHTENIVGFIGISDESGQHVNLQIHSRFDSDQKQYFFQYMLQKVFSVTILNFDKHYRNENIFELFLALLFPYYLKRAFRQGLFKKYRRFHYNNPNVKGAVDVKRHIQQNIPFAGNIAYTTREFSFDNPVTQLIRHTINYLENKNWLFDKSTEFRQAAQEIANYTPDFNPQNKIRIMRQNRQRITHPYFYEYEPLRKICLRILQHEGIGLTDHNKTDKIYGVVFDCAWLWEEYLNTVFVSGKKSFTHPENKNRENAIYLFERDTYPRYPDFYNDKIVLDAKYKHLEKENNELGRDDIHQIITYMHVLNKRQGGFLFPFTSTESIPIGKLKGAGGDINKISLGIPVSDSFSEFENMIGKNEQEFLAKIEAIR